MQGSKIHLSVAETELMLNAGIILTKNSVLEKIKLWLEELQREQINFISEHGLKTTFPFQIGPKISKGENYKGLPYLILDYPRISEGKNLFFIRNMFWWGNYFSTTLHLSGNYKEDYLDRIKDSYDNLDAYNISINIDQWQHQLDETNYKKITDIQKQEFEECCDTFEYIKIATVLPLENWQMAVPELLNSWKSLLKICRLIS